MTTTLRIIKKSTCPKLSTRAKGSLTYHACYAATDKSFHIRITANAGGFFSNEYISLDDVLATIESNGSDSAFKALLFKPFYQSKGANNHGFLAAALLAEGVLKPKEGKALSFVLGDVPAFKTAMNKLIKEKGPLAKCNISYRPIPSKKPQIHPLYSRQLLREELTKACKWAHGRS